MNKPIVFSWNFLYIFAESLGVPFQAEIIPSKPDAGHAAEGKSEKSTGTGGS